MDININFKVRVCEDVDLILLVECWEHGNESYLYMRGGRMMSNKNE